MIFHLECYKGDKLVNYYLNNWDLSLYTEYGDPVWKQVSYSNNKVPVTTDRLHPDYSDLQDIVIFVGSRCNFKCKYCPEIPFRNDEHNSLHADIERFKREVKANIDLTKIRSLMISGGEPLVYWQSVRQILGFFNENCPNLRWYRMISNGSLLTDEIMQEIDANGCRLTVSEDGGANAFRKPRTEKETAEIYQRYDRYCKEYGHNFAIRYSLGKHHLDAVECYHYFKQNIPHILRIADQGVIECTTPVSDVSNIENMMFFTSKLSVDELRLISDSRYQLLLENRPECHKSNSILRQYRWALTNRKTWADQYVCDNAYGHGIHLTLNGDILDCLWTPTARAPIGHVTDMQHVDVSNRYQSWEFRDNCYKCPIVPFCRGICSKATNYSINQSCPLTYADKLAYFKAAFKLELGVDIVSIKPLEGEPTEAMSIFNDYLTDYQKARQKVKQCLK